MGNRVHVATSCATKELVRPKAEGKGTLAQIAGCLRVRRAETLPTYVRCWNIPWWERCSRHVDEQPGWPIDSIDSRGATRARDVRTISSRNRAISAAHLIYVTISVPFGDGPRCSHGINAMRNAREIGSCGNRGKPREEQLLSHSFHRKIFNCWWSAMRLLSFFLSAHRGKLMKRRETIAVLIGFPSFSITEKMSRISYTCGIRIRAFVCFVDFSYGISCI